MNGPAPGPRLSFGQLEAALANLCYRPGWCLTVFSHPWDGPVLRITAQVPNSYHPDEMTSLGINSPIPPMDSVEQFERWLAYRLVRVESHECREWFRRRSGGPVFDPHIPLDEVIP